jgi:hypothetical protein
MIKRERQIHRIDGEICGETLRERLKGSDIGQIN